MPYKVNDVYDILTLRKGYTIGSSTCPVLIDCYILYVHAQTFHVFVPSNVRDMGLDFELAIQPTKAD